MHDIKFIRENPDEFDAGLKKRGHKPMAKHLLEIDSMRRKLITLAEEALREKNEASKKAGKVKATGDEKEFERLRALIAERKEYIAEREGSAKATHHSLIEQLSKIPNLPMDEVPVGKDENDNKEFHRWGDIPQFGKYTPQEHFNIPAVSKGMDFETAGKISGSRFVLLSGAIARVHRALAQFMLDLHINEHGLTEINTPVIANTIAMFGTGQLPKFADDCYRIHDDNSDVENAIDYWLIPTSEVTLTNIVAGKDIVQRLLPHRYCAHSLCFRKEAGSAGRDTAGMLRQHQFEKVEMVSITTPEKSREELDIMTTNAQNVLEKLGLPYRTMLLCTGDMGFSARQTHDIEVWLPGQNRYREISSVSLCGDFQARRMKARIHDMFGRKSEFVHTLNGSGVAVGRCLIAVLENGQQENGTIKLPKVLHRYLGENDHIDPNGDLQKTTGK